MASAHRRENACRAAKSDAVANKLLVLTDKLYVDWLLHHFLPHGEHFRVQCAEAIKPVSDQEYDPANATNASKRFYL